MNNSFPNRKMSCCLEYGEDKVPYIKINDYALRLDLEELDDEFKDKAEKELRETPEVVEDALEQLKKMLQDEKEKGLFIPFEDDNFLVKFLRPCKFYPDSTLKLIQKHYKFRTKNPKYCTDLLPDKVAHVFKDNVIQFLPTRTQQGSRIMVINAGEKWKVKNVTLQDLFRSVMMALEIAMIEPRTQVGGVHVVLDMIGLSLNHVYQFTPYFAKMVLDWVQECTPVRLKGIHVVNQPYIFNMLYRIFKPFIREKLRKRIHFHGTNWNNFTGILPAKSLPDYYGGEMAIMEFPGHLLAELLCLYKEDFALANSYGYNKGHNDKKI
ncbi:alpha-tocopherol transfer protein isoform X1 [Agrilus planipennis]|uniref:Alpha-tocopherol transfer protein isoform X1 n=2 Tax=Agrilus planipennis TaxID=224129 RepID=A0A7F5R564_AGRPL|nr:alpha-tocopherol transfer protein isoform X1 [Agrilus planipennis]